MGILSPIQLNLFDPILVDLNFENDLGFVPLEHGGRIKALIFAGIPDPAHRLILHFKFLLSLPRHGQPPHSLIKIIDLLPGAGRPGSGSQGVLEVGFESA